MTGSHISIDRLREVFHYDEETGVFTRKLATHRRLKPGQRAGATDRGYVRIGIDGRNYFAHRLAWFYVHGYWPQLFIDHINRNPSDNRLVNLREATRAQNRANSRTAKDKGVVKSGNRWQAQITINGHNNYLGTFKREADAAEAYRAAARAAFGEFANFKKA